MSDQPSTPESAPPTPPPQPESTTPSPAPVAPTPAAAPPAPAAPAPPATAATEAPQTATEPAAPRPGRKGDYIWGTGRRKSSVARVRIKPGEGKFVINKRDPDDYFNEEKDRNIIVAPLKSTGVLGKIDVIVSVHGGGCTGQAGAIMLGLARALKSIDSSHEATLRANGFLTRDPRMKERKKPGQPGARKKFQFSKR